MQFILLNFALREISNQKIANKTNKIFQNFNALLQIQPKK